MKKPVLILAAVALLAVAWAFRWQPVEIHVGEHAGAMFLLNRWTGEVRYVQGAAYFVAEEIKQ